MLKNAFRHCSKAITAQYRVPGLCRRGKVPRLVKRKRVKVNAAFKKIARLLCQLGQRVLQSVKNLPQKPRPQLYRKHIPAEFASIAYPDAARHLKNLQRTDVPAYADYLAL